MHSGEIPADQRMIPSSTAYSDRLRSMKCSPESISCYAPHRTAGPDSNAMGGTMDHDTYPAGVAELYAAEVLGEGLASRWLELTSVPDHRYKLGLFLQLESEA